MKLRLLPIAACVATTLLVVKVAALWQDVDAFIAALDLPLVHPPADQAWLWREARLADPSGNVICIYHAGENRRFPPWRVAADAGEG